MSMTNDMTHVKEPLWRSDRAARSSAVSAVQNLSYASDLLAAALHESGGSIDLGYEALGAATLRAVEVIPRADRLGVTVRLVES